MIDGIKIEICAGSLTDVIAASGFSEVDRIELNSALELGGITPSRSTFLLARQNSDKKLICMARPRGAGFVYNGWEKETMMQDARFFLENGADGIVFGCLNPDLTVDVSYARRMTEMIHSFGKEAVFHKAFDETPDPEAAAETLISCGIDRILTGGKQESAEDGTPLLALLQKKYGTQTEILPGGGVSERNVVHILAKTGCASVHMSAKETKQDCGEYFAVSTRRIRQILRRIQDAGSRPAVLTSDDTSMINADRYEEDLYQYHDDERDQ